MVYMTETETKTGYKSEVTTKPVSGVKWYFWGDFYALRTASGAKSLPARKSNLKRLFSKK